MDVSKVTIHKDIDLLERRELIRHGHGFVVPVFSEDVNNRLAYHYDIKSKIVKVAAELVQDSETVMMESGSCCAILAYELSARKRDITIITNSAFIAGYVRNLPYAKIILLGGDYQSEAQVMIGPLTRKSARQFKVHKFFTGIDGFSKNSGFTGNNHRRVETLRGMSKQAEEVFVLTESEKFSKLGVVSLLPLHRVSTLITDACLPPEIETLMLAARINLYKVPL